MTCGSIGIVNCEPTDNHVKGAHVELVEVHDSERDLEGNHCAARSDSDLDGFRLSD